MSFKCPGALKFRQPQPEIIKCPSCSCEIEIWTDEVKAICPGCKGTLMRKQGSSCLDWCKYAKECLGDRLYNEYIKNKAFVLLKQGKSGKQKSMFEKGPFIVYNNIVKEGVKDMGCGKKHKAKKSTRKACKSKKKCKK